MKHLVSTEVVLLVAGIMCREWHQIEARAYGQCDGRSSLQEEFSPATQQLVVASTWKRWCDQEKRDPKDQPPLFAMYRVESYDEAIMTMLSDDGSEEATAGRSRAPNGPQEKPATGKRIMLTLAIWPDGKAVWLRGPDSECKELSEARVSTSQLAGLRASLSKLRVFEQPINTGRYVYVDVGYWVIEVNDRGRRLHLESWDMHPSATSNDTDLQRFRIVWRATRTWAEGCVEGWKRVCK